MPMTHVEVKKDHEAYTLLAELIKEHHTHLEKSKIRILFRTGNNWVSNGRDVFAKIGVLSDQYRRTYGTDVHLVLNEFAWNEVLSVEQKRYLLDEQLSFIQVQKDKDDKVKHLDDGRPKLKKIPYDFEGFASVINRHGLVMEEAKTFVKAMASAEQLNMEEYLGDDEQSQNVIKSRFGAQLAEVEAGEEQAAATATPN